MTRIPFLAATVVALATIVMPAQAAKPTTPHPKCVAHTISYEVSGTLTATGSLTANGDGTYNGSLSVHVTRADDHARADKGAVKSYALDHAKVSFGHGVSKTAPAAGTRVELQGTITSVAKRCSGFTPTTKIGKVELHAAKK